METKLNQSNYWQQIERVATRCLDLVESGTEIIVDVKKVKSARSLAQNKLLHKWHGELKRHIELTQGGIFTNTEIHEYVVSEIGNNQVFEIDGKQIVSREKTSKMSVKRLSEFLGTYERWARERYNCNFSHPEDMHFRG